MRELTVNDWMKLYKHGLITARGIEKWGKAEFKDLNGHVYTTELSKQMKISKSYNTNIMIGKTIYTVRYYSGCFTPMWFKGGVYNENDSNYKLDIKTNEINLVENY
jgi:hypothetical protein